MRLAVCSIGRIQKNRKRLGVESPGVLLCTHEVQRHIWLVAHNPTVMSVCLGVLIPLGLSARFVRAGVNSGDISPKPGHRDLENVDRIDYPPRPSFLASAGRWTMRLVVIFLFLQLGLWLFIGRKSLIHVAPDMIADDVRSVAALGERLDGNEVYPERDVDTRSRHALRPWSSSVPVRNRSR